MILGSTMYSPEPIDKEQFTKEFDRVYSRFARIYDLAVKWFPVWRNWISHALPHIRGPDVLEISFGTGYLLTQYADKYEAHGIDYNWELACTAKHNLQKNGRSSIDTASGCRIPAISIWELRYGAQHNVFHRLSRWAESYGRNQSSAQERWQAGSDRHQLPK